MTTTPSTSQETVVLYHANCTDGFTAAWCAHKKFPGATFLAVEYGKPVPTLPHNATIYILDFSYSREELVKICEYSGFVALLDHHKTAQETLENWVNKPGNLHITFDMFRSGARIAFDYFNSRYAGDYNLLVNYVEDRDLWRFKLAKSKQVSAYISNTTKDFSEWDRIAEALEIYFDDLVDIGSHLLTYHDRICKQITQDSRPVILQDINGNAHVGLEVNCTSQFASEVGHILATRCGAFGATYYIDRNESIHVSLRSNGDFDVSKIAKYYGGGGHKNASGFIAAADKLIIKPTLEL